MDIYCCYAIWLLERTSAIQFYYNDWNNDVQLELYSIYTKRGVGYTESRIHVQHREFLFVEGFNEYMEPNPPSY